MKFILFFILGGLWIRWVRSLDREDPLEKETATHSSILTWKIPWTEEPGRLQSKGSQKVKHGWTQHTAEYHYIILLFVFYYKLSFKVYFFCMSIATLTLFSFELAWNIFFHHFTFILCVFSSEVSYRQNTEASCILFISYLMPFDWRS